MKMTQEKKLGRGLSALLGEAKLENKNGFNKTHEGDVQMITVNNLIAGIYQPRRSFDPQKLQELSDSIRENGLIQPIIVRKSDAGAFEIIAGERRFKASKMAGLDKIPAIVKDIDNIQALEFAIVENVQRADLSLIEEALGYKQLITEFHYTQDQVAKKIGHSRSHIANILRLLSLPQEVQDLVAAGQLSFGHAKLIINSENPVEIARQIVANGWSVRDVETIFNNHGEEAVIAETEENNPPLKKKSAAAKKQKTNPAAKIQNKIQQLFPENLVKADYNFDKEKGKITIFFKDLEEMQELVDSF